jgi:hypothetical protein
MDNRIPDDDDVGLDRLVARENGVMPVLPVVGITVAVLCNRRRRHGFLGLALAGIVLYSWHGKIFLE